MTPAACKRTLNAIGFSQRSFAKFIGIDERTVRRWMKNGIPPEIACLVQAMMALHNVRLFLDGERGTHGIVERTKLRLMIDNCLPQEAADGP